MFLTVGAGPPPRRAPGDSARAHALLVAAAAREAQLDEHGYAEMVRAAFRADPDYLPAIFRITALLGNRVGISERLRLLTHAPGLAPVDSACLTLWTPRPRDARQRVREVDSVERRFGASDCTRSLRVDAESALPAADRPPHLFDVAWPRVVEAAGDVGDVWLSYAGALVSSGDTTTALAVAHRALGRNIDPPSRFALYSLLTAIHRARGDSASVHQDRTARNEWVARHPTPEVRYLEHKRRWTPWTEPRRVAAAEFRQSTAIALAHHATAHLIVDWLLRGGMLHDTGHETAAKSLVRLALAASDSAGWLPFRLRARIDLARVDVTSGRWRDAIRVLRVAARICEPADQTYRALIHQYLAEAWERGGRMDDAIAEAGRFVAIADSVQDGSMHMISLHDAGVIKWEAGLHAAARLDFQAMVGVVDSTHQNYYWAGHYYERIGDLQRALAYYRRVPRTDAEEGARALSGLTRVYYALGMPDSAAAAARAHDHDVQTPEEVPLLPGVLAAQGRVADALRISRAWADSQVAEGNVRGAANADLELARLLLDHGDPGQALDEGRRAGAIAARAHLPAERGRAAAVQAAAELHLGRTAVAVRDARIARRQAIDQGTDADRRDAGAVLGDALAASGDPRGALAAYDGAARVIESMGRTITADVGRARFHARQLDVFDKAVRLLLAMPPSGRRTAALIAWAQRRAVAAFPRGRSRPRPLALPQLEARLGRRRALVDYLLLDSVSAAIVVTSSGARIVSLDAPLTEVRPLVAAVRRPYGAVYLGTIDLSRVTPDTLAASRLARLLLRPIQKDLGGRSRVLIVPDGPLYLLPFDLLPLDDTTLVVDRYAVSLLPSMRALAATPKGPLPKRAASLLLVGGDAPGATRELEAVRRQWTVGPVRTLAAGAATETAIRDALAHYAVLHFATHAVVDADDPLDSHLVLAPDAHADGLFHLSEIEQTPSHARLVVLSACESVNGRSFAGVGPIGLARAFLVGGARAVVATQWPVAATAADLMNAFYARLAAGDPPDEALRAAKESLRRDPATSNPFNWAGFVLVGNDGVRFGG